MFTRLIAPAALGLLSPLAPIHAPATAAPATVPATVQATAINLAAIDAYAASARSGLEQVTSITQFSDVQPTEWAYQALSSLVERYGCVAGYPDGTFRGKRSLSRWEAAALLNACLDRITEVTDELRRLMKEFEVELSVLKGRVDGLEAKVGELEASQFSTTTVLKGEATFVLGAVNAGGNSFGNFGPGNDADNYNQQFGSTNFSYDLRLNLETSFTGKDLLFTRLRTGNFENAFGGDGVNISALDRSSSGFGGNNSVGVDRLYYRFPVGDQFTFVVGPRARNTESLAVTPSVYRAGILDYFAVNGAPGTYNKATGALVAAIWKQNVEKGRGRFSFAANYVAQQGNVGQVFDGNPNNCSGSEGGIGTDCARGSIMAQLNYTAPQWNVSLAYRYGQQGTNFRRGTNFVSSNSWFLANGESNNFAVNAYWQPKNPGIIPSISVGWGLNSLSGNSINSSGDEFEDPYVTQSQSWFAGLQWKDVFAKGNEAGMAVGQATFATQLSQGSIDGQNTTPNDGNFVWEWWYKFQVTDNISVTPAIFYLSRPLGQLTSSNRDFNVFGGLIQTRFKF